MVMKPTQNLNQIPLHHQYRNMTATSLNTKLLMLHAAATLFMTGLIWFVQIVHYPLFDHVGAGNFAAYEQEHTRRTGWVVVPPMLVELATAILLVWRMGGAVTWTGLVLLALIWLSTFGWQVPAHERLETGFDAPTYRWLVLSNWVRTVAWSVRGWLALYLLKP